MHRRFLRVRCLSRHATNCINHRSTEETSEHWPQPTYLILFYSTTRLPTEEALLLWFIDRVKVFSERELTAVARPSVCVSVCNAHAPYSDGWYFRQFSTSCGTLAVRWHPQKIYGDRPRETPPSWELNARGVAVLGLSKAMSRKRYKIVGKLVLITNRKSYMSFRSVSKSVTLNGLEWRNGPYFALFHRIR